MPTTLTQSIVDFRGDFELLASMMRESWTENPNPSMLYTPSYLRSMFEYPGSTFALAPSLYKPSQQEILGFVAGFPRLVRWEEKPTKLVVDSFLTAARSVKGSGLGLRLLFNLIDRSRLQGYDGLMSFCVEGDSMDSCMPYFARALGLNTRRIFTVNNLIRMLYSKGSQRDERVDVSDIDLFLELSANIGSQVGLGRIWSREEAEWQCRDREGAVALSFRNGTRAGMVTGYLLDEASELQVKILILEDLLWGNLLEEERAELLDRIIKLAAFRGARIATCPILGYASLEPLKMLRFRRSGRVLHTYLTLWNGSQPAEVRDLYVDVF